MLYNVCNLSTLYSIYNSTSKHAYLGASGAGGGGGAGAEKRALSESPGSCHHHWAPERSEQLREKVAASPWDAAEQSSTSGGEPLAPCDPGAVRCKLGALPGNSRVCTRACAGLTYKPTDLGASQSHGVEGLRIGGKKRSPQQQLGLPQVSRVVGVWRPRHGLGQRWQRAARRSLLVPTPV